MYIFKISPFSARRLAFPMQQQKLYLHVLLGKQLRVRQ